MPETSVNASAPNGSAVGSLGRGVEWLKQRERPVLITAIVFQVAVLLTMIGLQALPLLGSDTILVRVVPVDPRDLFRGDYVVLGYEFSVVPPAGIEGLAADSGGRQVGELNGRIVYVSLVPEPDGSHWRGSKVSIHRPPTGRYIRGRIAGSSRLEFGIEAFYLEEGSGRRYEQAIGHRRLSAVVALSSNGRAALRDLRIEGDP